MLQKMETANEILMAVAKNFFLVFFFLVVYEVTKTLGVIIWHSLSSHIYSLLKEVVQSAFFKTSLNMF